VARSEIQDGRVTRAERQRRERRESVLAAARRVFADKGYHTASITDILDAADIARGTFYLYFPSKRAIFDELLDNFFDHLRENVRPIVVDGSAPPPLEQMRKMVRHVLEDLVQNGDLTGILLHEAMGIDQEFDEKVRDFYGRILGLLQGALTMGKNIGLVRSDLDPVTNSYCILGSVKELVSHLVAEAEAGRAPDLERITNEVVNFNLSGVFRGQ
jgi:AcrR family transcriptional regulator